MPIHPSTRSWEINRELVEIIKVIGRGAFSQVAKATAWSISDKEECTTVAVKMLKGTVTGRLQIVSYRDPKKYYLSILLFFFVFFCPRRVLAQRPKPEEALIGPPAYKECEILV